MKIVEDRGTLSRTLQGESFPLTPDCRKTVFCGRVSVKFEANLFLAECKIIV